MDSFKEIRFQLSKTEPMHTNFLDKSWQTEKGHIQIMDNQMPS